MKGGCLTNEAKNLGVKSFIAEFVLLKKKNEN
jgi:hypothetical protein